MAGYPDPRRSYGSKELDLPFALLLKTYKDEDPAPKPQLALPVHAIQFTCQMYWADNTARSQATADLIVVAFFFLLRVGEYTFPTTQKKRRTTQFRLKDIILRKQGTILRQNASLTELQTADSVTMTIDRQKNGQKGATIHHHATGTPFCPVLAICRRIYSIRQHTQDVNTPISFVSRRPTGVHSHIHDNDITIALRCGAAKAGLLLRGYTLAQISSHSLRASGAMALKLAGADDTTIQKLGRWSSRTFLMYIHTQIAAYSAGWAAKMAAPIDFIHVG